MEVIVIGAGPAGLATSRELGRAGVDHVVLERGATVGHTWEHLYDGLVLHTGKRWSALPGLPFPASTPTFPTRRDFADYLHRYAGTFRLPVETGATVSRVDRDGDRWVVRTVAGRELRAPAVVVATGIVSNPHVPAIANQEIFRGAVGHSVDYRRGEPYAGQRVLVVGAGNSAADIAVELARAGAQVTLAVRSGARVVPLRMLGIPSHYVAVAMGWLPADLRRTLPIATAKLFGRLRGPSIFPEPPPTECPGMPQIGFHLDQAIRAGAVALKGALQEFTEEGVRFSDGSSAPFDRVMLATGYRAALGPIRHTIQVDRCGFAVRRDRVTSADWPNLYFVGHNYDTQGGLRNIGRDARLVARAMAR